MNKDTTESESSHDYNEHEEIRYDDYTFSFYESGIIQRTDSNGGTAYTSYGESNLKTSVTDVKLLSEDSSIELEYTIEKDGNSFIIRALPNGKYALHISEGTDEIIHKFEIP